MKLSRYDIQKLEDYWFNIELYKEKLRHRELDLLNPVSDGSEIVGGRSSNISDTTASKAILLAQDELYQNLKRIVNGIEKLSQSLTEDEEVIVNMRYRSPRGINEWEDIIYELGYSRRKVLAIRNNLMDKTVKEIKYV